MANKIRSMTEEERQNVIITLERDLHETERKIWLLEEGKYTPEDLGFKEASVDNAIFILKAYAKTLKAAIKGLKKQSKDYNDIFNSIE